MTQRDVKLTEAKIKWLKLSARKCGLSRCAVREVGSGALHCLNQLEDAGLVSFEKYNGCSLVYGTYWITPAGLAALEE